MASKLPMLACLVLVAVLCLALVGNASDCNTGCGLFGAKSAVSMKTENRKILASLKEKKETVKGGLQVSATISNGGGFLGWELRRVPSGPDPLHHNGGNPKKPRAL
ncbi:protein CLAVATA 3 [Carya illinoinensis]|uniref:Uncharacterized protein n=1 Tax=Carya illinoinensis TaxID=32201 RepID=A0A8T1NS74_CARIL|nr:protein CLAVATA 3 [Carya illinoinensis]XP_042955311.1 protein CLAVATA 3 [Carya illinoinensis]KAG6632034.1 hypothetical protein CIPAW_13G130800 [Carya illinoinensis]